MPLANFKWRRATPPAFESSPSVRRYFCGTCGSPLGLEASHYQGAMHVYAASLTDPATLAPEFHLKNKSRLHWLKMDYDLPKNEGTPFQTSDEAGQGD
ncbi:MAG: GFA family protein [Pseudomonadota bacterium]|nr:GFA family protein [Pseudomonadota bacterium]